MPTDFLTYNDIPDSLDPAARQRHDLAIHTAGVNWLRARVEDLEATGHLIVNAYTDGNMEAAGLAIRRLAGLLGRELQ